MGYLVNKYNFIRWDDLGNNPDADTSTPIAKGYVMDEGRCDWQPIIVLSEAMRFYVNAIEGTSWINEDCTLDLINAVTGATTKQNCATLQKDEFNDSAGDPTFNYYSEVVLDPLDVPPGKYYFNVVGPTPGFKIWMKSNPFFVVASTNTTILRQSSVVVWRHDRSLCGFRYQALTDFTNKMRLQINQIDEQEESDVEVYKEQTTGQRREYNTNLDLLKTVECYYFSDDEYEAAVIMFKSRSLTINGRKYIAKDSLVRDRNPLSKQKKANISLYDIEFSTINRCNP